MVSTKAFLFNVKKGLKNGTFNKARAAKMLQGKRASLKAKRTGAEKDLRLLNSFSNRISKRRKPRLALI